MTDYIGWIYAAIIIFVIIICWRIYSSLSSYFSTGIIGGITGGIKDVTNGINDAVKIKLVCPADKPYEMDSLCYLTPPSDWTMKTGGRLTYNGACPTGWTKATDGRCTQTGKVMKTTQSCASGQQSYGGSCYDNCPSGTSMTAAGTCGKSVVSSGVIPGREECPAGWTSYALTCSRAVDKGYDNYTWGCGTAAAKCYDGSTGCKNNCYKTHIAKIEVETTNRAIKCPSGKSEKNGMCYDNCPSGSTMSVQGQCTASAPYRGISTVTACESGLEKGKVAGSALCYNSSDSTWKSYVEGSIIKSCPIGYDAKGDITGACWQTGVVKVKA